ncbi:MULTISPECIES: hypothetical protein [unclassified Streptomyces]|uniref:hypothetical protein n=1 Tax=unclassified Streptomyces TaxID=2593676 RepID=UPI0033AA53AD
MQTLIRSTITSVCAAAALSAVLLGAGAVADAVTVPASGTHTTASAPTPLSGTATPVGLLSGSKPNGNIWGP